MSRERGRQCGDMHRSREYIVCWDNEVEIDSCTATSEQEAIDTIAEQYNLCADDLMALPAAERSTLYCADGGYDGI
jgi:hypothetical protein